VEKKHIAYFREVLSDHLEELLNNADYTVLSMTTPKENFPDITDRASFEADRDSMLRISQRKNERIKKIKEAFGRIENDTYAICKTCGEEISLARLIARPISTQCIDCKIKEEAAMKETQRLLN
jgi:DnaK suppressor protein